MILRKINYKIFANILVVLSLLFVAAYLNKQNLLETPRIVNHQYLILSIILVLAGFLIDAFAIRLFLRKNSNSISYKCAIELTGKFNLAKYIPGKIGVVLGKAIFLVERTKIKKYESIELFTVYQISFLISGLLIALVVLNNFISDKNINIVLYLIIVISVLVLLTFERPQFVFRKILNKYFKTNIERIYGYRIIFFTLIFTGLSWLVWAIGFLFMAKSIGYTISFQESLIFPFASIAGVFALISPGGLGIREGVISAGLVYFGHSQSDSITIGVYSRIWFLIGEITIFLIAILVSYSSKLMKKSVR